jgi:ABC-type phosphate/phosphonate transport system substrate-binding protein
MKSALKQFDTETAVARPLVAGLPMYDLPELQSANDVLWAAIAARLEDLGVAGAPRLVTRGRPLETLWTDPGLILAQACGYPLTTNLQGKVRLIATPRYRAPGCAGPFHRSAIVVRRDSPVLGLTDLRGGRCALNDRDSNSGMNLLRVEIAAVAGGAPFFGQVIVSGSHEASALAVADGDADVAAIDCVTWAHLQRYRQTTTDRLRSLMWTVSSPGLPLVAAIGLEPATHTALRRALAAVERDPALEEARSTLLLDGFNDLSASQYRAVVHLEKMAISQGYPELA